MVISSNTLAIHYWTRSEEAYFTVSSKI